MLHQRRRIGKRGSQAHSQQAKQISACRWRARPFRAFYSSGHTHASHHTKHAFLPERKRHAHYFAAACWRLVSPPANGVRSAAFAWRPSAPLDQMSPSFLSPGVCVVLLPKPRVFPLEQGGKPLESLSSTHTHTATELNRMCPQAACV